LRKAQDVSHVTGVLEEGSRTFVFQIHWSLSLLEIFTQDISFLFKKLLIGVGLYAVASAVSNPTPRKVFKLRKSVMRIFLAGLSHDLDPGQRKSLSNPCLLYLPNSRTKPCKSVRSVASIQCVPWKNQ